MNTESIKRETKKLKYALANKDVSKILNLVHNFYQETEDFQKIMHSLNNQSEQRSFISAMKKYERLIYRSKDELNAYVHTQTANFLHSDIKSLFLSVLETLISLRIINWSFSDKQQLQKTLLLFLSTAESVEGGAFKQVCDILALPDPDYDSDQKEIQLFGQNVNKQFLENLIRRTFGNNYKALTKFSSVKLPDAIDIKQDCTIHQRKCDQFIPSKNAYFIAFPFNRRDIEKSIVDACMAKFYPFEYEIARNRFENLTVLCQICKMILSSRFGIYILTKDSQRANGEQVPNPNVMLELGLAMGAKKRAVILIEKGTDVPADVLGNLRIEFDDAKNIPAIIKNTSFKEFLEEVNQ